MQLLVCQAETYKKTHASNFLPTPVFRPTGDVVCEKVGNPPTLITDHHEAKHC